MVSTSNHLLVDMADLGHGVEIEGDVLVATIESACRCSAREAQTPRSLPQTKTTKKESSTSVHSAEIWRCSQS